MSSSARIQEIRGKIKGLINDRAMEWGLPLIVLFVGLSSFALGRISASEAVRPIVSVAQAASLAEPQGLYIGGLYVGSWNGRTYHYPWCPGAAQIAEKNRRWFETKEAAERAGYRPAKNCTGLE